MRLRSKKSSLFGPLINAAAACVIILGTWLYGNGAAIQGAGVNQAARSEPVLQNGAGGKDSGDTAGSAVGTSSIIEDKQDSSARVANRPDSPARPSRTDKKDESEGSAAIEPAFAKQEEEANLADPGSTRAALTSGLPEQAAQVLGQAEAQLPAATDALIDPLSLARPIEGLYTNAGVGPDLTGSNPGTKPLEASAKLANATKGEPYCQTLPNSLSPLAPFSRSGGIIPKGLILDRDKGSLCGTPAETGIFRFEVTSRNRSGDLIRASYRLTVAEGTDDEADLPLKITTAELTVGFLGSQYSFQLTAEGGTAPREWSASGLPDGLELDSETGVIGGSSAIDGEFTVAVTVKDAAGETASSSFQLIIRTTPVFITTSALAAGQAGMVYQERLSAQGGVPPYSWGIIQGAAPEGITFSPAVGTLEGTPGEASDNLIRFQVLDSEGKSDSADLELRIKASDLDITTAAVAEAFGGTDYKFALAAAGGTPPYSWRLKSGALPSGLVIGSDGVISGRTDSDGEFLFTIEVADQSTATADKRYSLRVQPSADPDPGSSSSSSGDPGIGGGPGSSSSSSSSGGEPIDTLPGVTQLRSVPSDRKVGLSWKNPARSDFLNIVVIRSDDHQPQSIDDGVTVYSGAGTSALDPPAGGLPLSNDTTYYYTVFADYGAEGLSSPSVDNETAAQPRAVTISGVPDPYVDSVASFSPLDKSGCYNCSRVPEIVLGPPVGGGEYSGSADIVSLGAKINNDREASAPYGGTITLRFDDNIVANGPGPDFVIFENAFRLAGTDNYFIEPAVVEVSVDGVTFYRFPFDFVPHFNAAGELNLFNPFCYARGFAGVHPVYSSNASPDPTKPQIAGGDPFDLSDIPGADLQWISYVRITSTGDNWLIDADGDAVRHSNSSPFFGASGRGNSGFDLDAAAAIHY